MSLEIVEEDIGNITQIIRRPRTRGATTVRRQTFTFKKLDH